MGVEEASLDELNRSKLKPEKVSLLDGLPSNLEVVGGKIMVLPAMYSVIVSVLKRESVVYIYSPAGRLWVTGSNQLVPGHVTLTMTY